MKNIYSAFIMVVFLTSCATTGSPSDSNYLRSSYGIPTVYKVSADSMTNNKTVTSPGIILYNASIGWANTGMWWSIIQSSDSKKTGHLIIKATMKGWSFFDEVYIKVNDEVLHFSENKRTLNNEREVIGGGNVEEFIVCNIELKVIEKIIKSKNFEISIRGRKGRQDYTIPQYANWLELQKHL